MLKREKGYGYLWLVVPALTILLPAVLLALIVLGGGEVWYLLIAGALISFIVGVLLPLKKLRATSESRSSRGLHFVALGLDIACPILLLLGPYVASVLSSTWALLGLLVIIFGILAPIAGVVTGVQALSEARKSENKVGVVISLIAILAPIIAAAYSIVMFSTGVWVIRFM